MLGKPVRIEFKNGKAHVSGIPASNTIHLALKNEDEYAVLHSKHPLTMRKGSTLHIGMDGEKAVKAKILSTQLDAEKLVVFYRTKGIMGAQGHFSYEFKSKLANMAISRKTSHAQLPVLPVDVIRA